MILLPPVRPCRISSPYGMRTNPLTHQIGSLHTGLDFACPCGTEVRAAAAGIVERAYESQGDGLKSGDPDKRLWSYGLCIWLEHGHSVSTRYAHLSEILVKEGQHVERGQVIARSGSTGDSTGPHLHFEARIAGRSVDPAPFLDPEEDEPPRVA